MKIRVTRIVVSTLVLLGLIITGCAAPIPPTADRVNPEVATSASEGMADKNDNYGYSNNLKPAFFATP